MKLPLVLLLFALFLPLSAAPISQTTLAAVYVIADHAGVPRSIARALCIEESGDWRTGTLGDAAAVGSVGADGARCLGLYQLNPRWMASLVARYFPDDPLAFDAFDPLDNATVALAYLSALHARFGSWISALAFYNHGDVETIPAETLAYCWRIVSAK